MKHFYQIYISLALLLCCTMASAQSISGLVRDIAGRPLPGVSISIKGKKAVALTANDGRFSIAASGADTLIMHKNGYITKEVTIYNREFLTLNLYREVETIDEVKVV